MDRWTGGQVGWVEGDSAGDAWLCPATLSYVRLCSGFVRLCLGYVRRGGWSGRVVYERDSMRGAGNLADRVWLLELAAKLAEQRALQRLDAATHVRERVRADEVVHRDAILDRSLWNTGETCFNQTVKTKHSRT